MEAEKGSYTTSEGLRRSSRIKAAKQSTLRAKSPRTASQISQPQAKAPAKAPATVRQSRKAISVTITNHRQTNAPKQTNKHISKFLTTNKISRAKSMPTFRNTDKKINNKLVKSMSLSNLSNSSGRSSLSPILKRSSSTSFIDRSSPNKFLNYRLNIYNYLQNVKIMNYYLNIQKLLASIERGATGIVCLSNNSEIQVNGRTFKNFKFAIKLAENKIGDSVKEIYILQNMIPLIEAGYHNLPIIYSAFETKRKTEIMNSLNRKDISIEEFNKIKSFLEDTKKYNIYVNELAKGDLNSFLKLYDKRDSEITEGILLNAVAQIAMSIASLHSIGIRHNDTHYGNFLYHKIDPGGYIKYTIKYIKTDPKDITKKTTEYKTFYVKNLGYLWVIWDFGISTQLNGKTDYFNDYEMLSLFLRKDDGRYNMRFIAKNEHDKEIRRNHGNVNFVHKEIPLTIQRLTEVIYGLSIDKKTGIRPDVSKTEGDLLLTTRDKALKSKRTELSKAHYAIMDDKGEYLDESMFLVDHIIKCLSSVFETNIHVKDDDILYAVNLEFDQISFIREGANQMINYDKTVQHYAGKKIILLEKFYKTKG
jgi:hypothetical protein